jgi:hypothetical protein
VFPFAPLLYRRFIWFTAILRLNKTTDTKVVLFILLLLPTLEATVGIVARLAQQMVRATFDAITLAMRALPSLRA